MPGKFYIMHNQCEPASGWLDALNAPGGGGRDRGVYEKDPLLHLEQGEMGKLLLPWSENFETEDETEEYLGELSPAERGKRKNRGQPLLGGLGQRLQLGDVVLLRVFTKALRARDLHHKCCLVMVTGEVEHLELPSWIGESVPTISRDWKYAQFRDVKILISARELSPSHKALTPAVCQRCFIPNHRIVRTLWAGRYRIDDVSEDEWNTQDATELFPEWRGLSNSLCGGGDEEYDVFAAQQATADPLPVAAGQWQGAGGNEDLVQRVALAALLTDMESTIEEQQAQRVALAALMTDMESTTEKLQAQQAAAWELGAALGVNPEQ